MTKLNQKTLSYLFAAFKNSIFIKSLFITLISFTLEVSILYAFLFAEDISKTDYDSIFRFLVKILPYFYGVCVLFYLPRRIREYLKQNKLSLRKILTKNIFLTCLVIVSLIYVFFRFSLSKESALSILQQYSLSLYGCGIIHYSCDEYGNCPKNIICSDQVEYISDEKFIRKLKKTVDIYLWPKFDIENAIITIDKRGYEIITNGDIKVRSIGQQKL